MRTIGRSFKQSIVTVLLKCQQSQSTCIILNEKSLKPFENNDQIVLQSRAVGMHLSVERKQSEGVTMVINGSVTEGLSVKSRDGKRPFRQFDSISL